MIGNAVIVVRDSSRSTTKVLVSREGTTQGCRLANASLRHCNSPAHSTAEESHSAHPQLAMVCGWFCLLWLTYQHPKVVWSTAHGRPLLRLLCRATEEHISGEGRAHEELQEGQGDVWRPRRRHRADKSVPWRMHWQQERHWGVCHGQGGWLGENRLSTGRSCEVIPTVGTLRLHPFRFESVDLSAKSHGWGWRRVRTPPDHHPSTVHPVSAWEGSSCRRAHTVLPSNKARWVGNLRPYGHGLISLHHLESCHWSPTYKPQSRPATLFASQTTTSSVLRDTRAHRTQREKALLSSLIAEMPHDKRRTLKRITDWEASGWLTVLPLASEGSGLSGTQFQDQWALRYNHTPASFPKSCDGCFERFSVQHALDCKKGSLVKQGHNDVRDSDVSLAEAAWGGVVMEPVLVPENDRTAHAALQADLSVRGVWQPGGVLW